MTTYVGKADHEVSEIIEKEAWRQENSLELIASENCVSRAVMEVQEYSHQ